MNRPVNGTLVTIADTVETARVIDRYLRASLGERIESYFMTYRRTLLSGSLVKHTDLFILELLTQDDAGYRAEGIFTAEKWIDSGKRVLMVSGGGQSDIIDCPNYWDLAAPDLLSDRILKLLDAPPAASTDLTPLRQRVGHYYRPAIDLHGKKQGA